MFLAAVPALLLMTACSATPFGSAVMASDSTVTKKITVPTFTKVDISGLYNAEITTGKDFAVELTVPANFSEYYSVHVDDGELVAERTGDVNIRFKSRKDHPRLTITMPAVNALEVSGQSSVRLNGDIDATEFEAEVSGQSSLVIGNITGQYAEVTVKGQSSFSADSMDVYNSKVLVSGQSDAKVKYIGGERFMGNASGQSNLAVGELNTLMSKLHSGGQSDIQVSEGSGSIDSSTSGQSILRIARRK